MHNLRMDTYKQQTKAASQVAVKRIPDVLSSPEQAKRVLREICILRRLIHPFIIGLKNAFVQPSATGRLQHLLLGNFLLLLQGSMLHLAHAHHKKLLVKACIHCTCGNTLVRCTKQQLTVFCNCVDPQ